MNTMRMGLLTSIFLLATASACTGTGSVGDGDGDGDGDAECPVGSEACACTQGGACDDGLTCLSNFCVDAGDGGDGDGGDGDGGDGDGGDGDGDGPIDNYASCTEAQVAVDIAMLQCGLGYDADLQCAAYIDLDLDCTPVWDELTDSVGCENGQFVYSMTAGCRPEGFDPSTNVDACKDAQIALGNAFEDCDLDVTPDLSCADFDDYYGDCTGYFDTIAESATCEEGLVDWNNTGTCEAEPFPILSTLGPNNVVACQEAQEALDAAYADCEIDTNTDLSCETYADYSADCTNYFNTLADSAACTDGTVDWDSSGSCV